MTKIFSVVCVSCQYWLGFKLLSVPEIHFLQNQNTVLELGVQSAVRDAEEGVAGWNGAAELPLTLLNGSGPLLVSWDVLILLASVLPENRLCASCCLTKEGLHCPLLKKTGGVTESVSVWLPKEWSAQKIWCLKIGHILNSVPEINHPIFRYWIANLDAMNLQVIVVKHLAGTLCQAGLQRMAPLLRARAASSAASVQIELKKAE